MDMFPRKSTRTVFIPGGHCPLRQWPARDLTQASSVLSSQVSGGSCPVHSFCPSKAETKAKSTTPTPGPAQPPDALFQTLLLPQESHTQADLPNLFVPQMAVGPMARCPGAQWALSLASPFISFVLGSFSFLSVSLLAPVSKGRTLPLGSHDSDHIPSKEGQTVSKPNLGPAISFWGKQKK